MIKDIQRRVWYRSSGRYLRAGALLMQFARWIRKHKGDRIRLEDFRTVRASEGSSFTAPMQVFKELAAWKIRGEKGQPGFRSARGS